MKADCSAQEVGQDRERCFPKVGVKIESSALEAGSGGSSFHDKAGVSLPAQERSRPGAATTPRGETPHENEAEVRRDTGKIGQHEEQKAASESDGSAQLMTSSRGKLDALSAPEEAAAVASEGPYARGLGGRHVAVGGGGSGVPEVRQPIRARRVLLDLNSDPVDNEGSEGDNQLLNLF
jgi:hypothetical protein